MNRLGLPHRLALLIAIGAGSAVAADVNPVQVMRELNQRLAFAGYATLSIDPSSAAAQIGTATAYTNLARGSYTYFVGDALPQTLTWPVDLSRAPFDPTVSQMPLVTWNDCHAVLMRMHYVVANAYGEQQCRSANISGELPPQADPATATSALWSALQSAGWRDPTYGFGWGIGPNTFETPASFAYMSFQTTTLNGQTTAGGAVLGEQARIRPLIPGAPWSQGKPCAVYLYGFEPSIYSATWQESGDSAVAQDGQYHLYQSGTVPYTGDWITSQEPDLVSVFSGTGTDGSTSATVLGADFSLLEFDALAYIDGAFPPVTGDAATGPGTGPPTCSTCPCQQSMATGATTVGHSLIDNLRRGYIHDAEDLPLPEPGPGCATCGTTGMASDHLGPGALRFQRLHRYLDMDEYGSFGPGVFSSYDANLTLSISQAAGDLTNHITSIAWWSARQSYPYLFTASNGVFVNAVPAIVRDIQVYTADGQPTDLPTLAATARVHYWDGASDDFELFSLGDAQTLRGRVVAMRDRVGNATQIAYAYPLTATDAALGYDRTQLWEMASITDPEGRRLRLSYAWHDGQWVIATATGPGGATVTYGYDDGAIVGLDAVALPGGDASSFAMALDAASGQQRITIADAAATGMHRQKVIALTPSVWNGVACAPNRICQVVNGRGEIAYQAWSELLPSPDAHGADTYQYVFEGGGDPTTATAIGSVGTLMRLDVAHGAPVATHRAVQWQLYLPSNAFSWEDVEQVQTDGQQRITTRVTPNGSTTGLRTDYTRGAEPWAITGMSRYQDGTLLTGMSQSLNTFQEPLITTDENGHSVSRTYDAAGNRLSETVAVELPEQATRSWTYNANGTVSTATDELGNVTNFYYDGNPLLLTRRLDPPDQADGPRPLWQWNYDGAGRVATATDPLNRVTRYHYDTRGRLDVITYADNTTDVTTYGADTTANLVTQTTDRAGHVTVYGYDADGRRVTITTGAETPATQVTETITYVPGTALEATRSGRGRLVEYQYDYRLRRVATLTHVNATTTLTETTVYDNADRIDHAVDAYGRRTFFGYDSLNRVVRRAQELVVGGLPATVVVAGLSRVTGANPPYVIEDTAYDIVGNVVARIDGRGARTEMHLDGRDRTVELREAVGATDGTAEAVTATLYDAASNVQRVTSPGLRVVFSTYTGRNLLATRTEGYGTPDAGITSFTYTLTGKVQTRQDPNLHTTAYGYGTCCDFLTSVTDPLTYQTTYGRNGLGQLISVLDPDGNTSSRDYDALGRVLHDRRTNGGVVETTATVYDDNLADGVGLDAPNLPLAAHLPDLGLGALGTAVQVTTPEGHVAYTVFDGAGRPVYRLDARGNATSMTYDIPAAGGLVETVQTDALNHAVRSRADAAGVVRQRVDALGKVATTAADAQGNRMSTRDANGTGMDATYDLRGRQLTSTTTRTTGTAQSLTRTYDPDGNLLTEQDGLGQQSGALTRYAYDARNRRSTTTDRINGLTRFDYDAVGNLRHITDAELGVTTYAYTDRNELQSETFPPPTGGTRSYTYYPGGALHTRTDQRGIVTTYGYDGVDRLISRAYSDATADGFAYDHDGRLLSAASGRYGTTIARQYLANGLLDHETVTWPVGIGGNPTSTLVHYDYDAADRPTTVTYPDGQVLTRGFSDRNELQTLDFGGQRIATLAYDDGGRRTTTAFGNGLTETRSWDNNLLMGQIVAPASGPAVLSLGYAYDGNLRKTDETDLTPAAASQHFGYDDADRLTGWTGPAGASQSWLLSPVGDWRSTTINGVAQARTHTPVHEIATINTVPVLSDPAGNLIRTDAGQSFAWDDENRLLRADTVPNPDGVHGSASYLYDALGRRVAKTVFGTTTLFVPDGARVIQEIDTPTVLPASAAADDGALATLAHTPDGALIASNPDPAAPQPIRVNMQPATAAIPDGFLADKGKDYGVRSNGLSYGWTEGGHPDGVIRRFHPLPQYDTFQQLGEPNSGWAWQIAMPAGSYPVAVVLGDATSLVHNLSVTIQGQGYPETFDFNSQPTYNQGRFRLVTAQVTLAGPGNLAITAASGAYDPTLCFIEIGVQGTAFTAQNITDMQAKVDAATARTGGTAFWNGGKSETRSYIHSEYVDDVVAMKRTTDAGSSTYFVHSGSLYSPQVLTDASGAVVEKYTYDAYGKQTVKNAVGTVVAGSAVKFGRGFTGYILDDETGLCYARQRMYSSGLGRFLSRNQFERNVGPVFTSPWNDFEDVALRNVRTFYPATPYIDGFSLYFALFASIQGLDPSGEPGGGGGSRQREIDEYIRTHPGFRPPGRGWEPPRRQPDPGESWKRPSRNPQPNDISPYVGFEGMLGVWGRGITVVQCCGDDGQYRRMVFKKTCLGLGLGGSISGGFVNAMSGKGCDPANYSGWFLESSVSYGFAGIGFDLGQNQTTGGTPTGSSGIDEAGFSFGPGLEAKMAECYYTLIEDRKFGCCKK